MRISLLLLVLATSSCNAGDGAGNDRGQVASIGDSPKSMNVFESTDCPVGDLSDCSARDSKGRRYVFFDGALSMITVSEEASGSTIVLPAALQFGEDIELAKSKASKYFGVPFDRTSSEGKTIYSSGFSVRSPAGIEYSVVLVADERHRLAEIIQRTDF